MHHPKVLSVRDLVFTTPTGKGPKLFPLVYTPSLRESRTKLVLVSFVCFGGQIELSRNGLKVYNIKS